MPTEASSWGVVQWSAAVTAGSTVAYLVATCVIAWLTKQIKKVTEEAPIKAVEAARAASQADEQRKQQTQLLVDMMHHLFGYAAAWQGLQIALGSKSSAFQSPAFVAAEALIASAQSDYDKAVGALDVDLRMLDFLFRPNDERLKGLKKHVGEFYHNLGPDDVRQPTTDRANATCGVVVDTARLLGLLAVMPAAK